MSIANECMVVNIRIGFWAGHRLDKEASLRVTQEAQASDDAARVNKHLIPKEALKTVNAAATQVRLHFYKNTLPWKDNGDRLLTRRMFTKFMEEHGRLRDAFTNEVEQFLEQGYPAAKERARFRMGALFNADDYPSADTLRRKFYVAMDIDPVATADDFRVTISKDQEAEIKQSIEEATMARINNAMGDVWGRISEAVENFHARMSGNTYFKSATIDNLREIVEMLPALNVLGDPQLDRIASDVASKLLAYDVADLRQDKAVRDAAAEEAAEILADMAGFTNAFRKAV
jgi:hypothetical protein